MIVPISVATSGFLDDPLSIATQGFIRTVIIITDIPELEFISIQFEEVEKRLEFDPHCIKITLKEGFQEGDSETLIFEFVFNDNIYNVTSLSDFNSISLSFSNQSYSTSLTPNDLYVFDNKLFLNLDNLDGVEFGYYIPEILAFNQDFDDGLTLNSEAIPNLDTYIFILQ